MITRRIANRTGRSRVWLRAIRRFWMYHKYIFARFRATIHVSQQHTGHRQFSSNHIEKKGENTMLEICYLCDHGSELHMSAIHALK